MKNRKPLFVLMLLILAFFQHTVSAKDEWLRVRSKNFNLIGNASEKDIRKVATKLEQFRESFRRLFSRANFSQSIPTNVVVFKSGSAYKPFKPKRADGKIDEFIAGYFQPGEDANYITLSTEGEDADTYGTIFHEYVHFIIDTNFGKSEVPPWFNEGLAEYYQTFEIVEDQKVKLGLPQNEHLALLQQSQLIPLEQLFKVSNYGLHQTGNHSRSIFYAEAWALIHYLVQSGKSEGLDKFLMALLKDVPAEKAFQDSYATTYAQMEKDLKKYVSQNSYKYSILTFKEKLLFDAEMQTTPLSESETNAYLGDLLFHTNRADDAEAYLQKAIQLAPDLSQANTTLGMVKLRQRKYDEAKKYLEKAISEDQKNHLAFYNYAYLLSREDRDEYGYVKAFPAEKSIKMRELLKKAIAINPAYTQSYELMAFVNLVNSEQLDEAIAYLRQALKYQPGNQHYALRIAEIYMRQEKFAEASQIFDKIAKTADEPELKAQAENMAQQLRRQQEMRAEQEKERQRYEAAIAEARKNGSEPVILRRNSGSSRKTMTPAEQATAEENAKLVSINQSLKKATATDKRLVGKILKIECKGKTVNYTVRANDGGETFGLTSADFESLALTAFIADAESAQVGCNANVADFNAVLTYKPATAAKSNSRGELTAIDFVPKNFRLMTAEEVEKIMMAANNDEQLSAEEGSTNTNSAQEMRVPPVLAIKNALRKPLAGEKQALGFIEKIECTPKGIYFYMKNGDQTIKLGAASPQAVQIRGFTPEISRIQFGCNLKQVDVPAVFTYKDSLDLKTGSYGEIVALEFVPKNFSLEQ